jgi:GPI-anchor transamidase subunit GAA1
LFAALLARHFGSSTQQLQIMQSLSLLLLGATLSTLATLNFSLAFVVGVLASPLSFIRPLPTPATLTSKNAAPATSNHAIALAIGVPAILVYTLVSPPVVLSAVVVFWKKQLGWLLLEMARGWAAQGVYTAFVVWAVWWPAWVLGGVVLYSGLYRR